MSPVVAFLVALAAARPCAQARKAGMGVAAARAAESLLTGWSGYAEQVRVDVGGFGKIAKGAEVGCSGLARPRQAAAAPVPRAMGRSPRRPAG